MCADPNASSPVPARSPSGTTPVHLGSSRSQPRVVELGGVIIADTRSIGPGARDQPAAGVLPAPSRPRDGAPRPPPARVRGASGRGGAVLRPSRPATGGRDAAWTYRDRPGFEASPAAWPSTRSHGRCLVDGERGQANPARSTAAGSRRSRRPLQGRPRHAGTGEPASVRQHR